MPNTHTWPVEITPIGPVAAGTLLWRKAGQLRLTVIVKAAFALVPNGTMPLVDATDLRLVDTHHKGSPAHSVREGSNLQPFLERADVLFAGSAFPPRGLPAQKISVRLAVARHESVLLDKTLDVYGDRSPSPGRPAPEPAPFLQMPLVYERAFGGSGVAANPVGIGMWSGQEGAGPLPNIVYPDPWQRGGEPAGFGPIAARWPARERLLRGRSPDMFAGRVVELPTDIDPAYFQSAPEDQRIGHLAGNEWILLENLHPLHPRMQMGLPEAQGRARAYSKSGLEIPIGLTADTLFIDGDAERCSVTWRGSYPVPHENVLAGMRVAAAVEILGKAIEWPDLMDLRRATLASIPVKVGTHVLRVEESPLETSIAAPFKVAKPAEARRGAPIPGAPWAATPAPAIPVPSSPFEETVPLENQRSAGAQARMPPPPPPRTPPRRPPAPSPQIPPALPSTPVAAMPVSDEGTLVLKEETTTETSPTAIKTPFPIAQPGAPPSQRAAIPGTPWDSAPIAPNPEPDLDLEATITKPAAPKPARPGKPSLQFIDDDEQTRTMTYVPRRPDAEPPDSSEEPALAVEAEVMPPSVPAAAPPEPTPAAPPSKPAWPWASPPPDANDTSAPFVPKPPPAPPPPPPPPAVNSSIYARFSKKKK